MSMEIRFIKKIQKLQNLQMDDNSDKKSNFKEIFSRTKKIHKILNFKKTKPSFVH